MMKISPHTVDDPVVRKRVSVYTGAHDEGDAAAQPTSRRLVRRRMKWLLAVALLGCKDPDPVEVVHRFTGEMCSCTTRSCATGVNERLTAWSESVPDKRAPRLTAALEPYMICFVKLLM